MKDFGAEQFIKMPLDVPLVVAIREQWLPWMTLRSRHSVQWWANNEFQSSKITGHLINWNMTAFTSAQDVEEHRPMAYNALGSVLLSGLMGQKTAVYGSLVFGRFSYDDDVQRIEPLPTWHIGKLQTLVAAAEQVLYNDPEEWELGA